MTNKMTVAERIAEIEERVGAMVRHPGFEGEEIVVLLVRASCANGYQRGEWQWTADKIVNALEAGDRVRFFDERGNSVPFGDLSEKDRAAIESCWAANRVKATGKPAWAR
jgi:hypothetical protein